MEREPSKLSSSPQAPTLLLPAEINAATRRIHHELNRLIIERLPLALPPGATDSAIFGSGIAAFARIYFTFEDVWAEYIHSAHLLDDAHDSHEAQLRRWLGGLRPDGLSRSNRLERDIRHIASRTGANLDSTSRKQEASLHDIRISLLEKPHTLVAYAWVLYLAIFSGGRYIREQLLSAGPGFWLGQQAIISGGCEKQTGMKTGMPGFSFLYFDGEQDGEDIKALFKLRLAEAETLLTGQERQDVVIAAIGLFEHCIALVGTLDKEVAWQKFRWRLFWPVGLGAAFLALCLLFCTFKTTPGVAYANKISR